MTIMLMKNEGDSKLKRGAELINSYVKTLPLKPGVYQMLNIKGEPLYIGKAKSLRKRVANYTQVDKLSNRLQRMVSEICSMEFITTNTEIEALLLEANLIKQLHPRYNILLKDDKSFVFIHIQKEHPWPKIGKHRGSQKEPGDYFGPFASVESVNDTLTTLHKVFLLRSCTDTMFASRRRPCLQYHIKRCCAPCVGYVDQATYLGYLEDTKNVLKGRTDHVQQLLANKMQIASNSKDFEQAAIYRDQIKALTQIQTQQTINSRTLKDADVIAVIMQDGHACVEVFFFRGGRNFGGHAFFPSHGKDADPKEILQAFITQIYQGRVAPESILTNLQIPDQQLLELAYNTKIQMPLQGKKKEIVNLAEKNAKDALNRKLITSATQRKLLKELQERLHIQKPLNRIEVYDNSHISGKHAVGAMVVTGPEGFMKNSYRTFNIRSDISPGDDYGMLKEVMQRRFKGNLIKDADRNCLPDLMIIDGGIGQLNTVCEMLNHLELHNINVLAISKGPERKPGEERLFSKELGEFKLEQHDQVFYFIQRLRDEVHRYAIGSHRQKRNKDITKSLLDEIDGIGPIRKKALLNHFGSAVNVSNAGLQDLQNVNGISKKIAQHIYDHFHRDH